MTAKSIDLKTKIPGPKSQALMERRRASVARGPFHITPIFAARAHGALIEDVDGNRLIDFAAGIGVVNAGHTAEPVVKAIQAQAAELVHGSFNVTPYESYIRLCEKLNRATPGSFAKKTFLANSGAEAVENAVKIARARTKRPAVICFEHGFHGRTYMAMTLTAKEKPYKVDFGPFNPEIYRAPYPYCYRWPGTSDPAKVSRECFAQFEDVIAKAGASNVAAVIIEPVAGEGGFIPVPKEFLAHLRAFCDKNGTVLIADEIQTGFGRTGTLFASEQLGLVPDLITMAKGLGAGMPISAVTGRAEIMDAPVEGGIGGTYGGNPVACAAALAVFEMFENGDLLLRARRLGETLAERTRQWAEKFSRIGDARGIGPMQAIEFVKPSAGLRPDDRTSKEPDADSAKALIRFCCERGVVVMTSGSYGNVVRFLMPLVIEPAQLEEGLAVVEAGLKELG